MQQIDLLHTEFPFAGARMLRHLLAAEGSKVGRRHVMGELLCALFEAGHAARLDHIVSVFDVRKERILNRANCPSKRLSPPWEIGGVMTVAGLFEVSDGKIAGLAAARREMPASF